MIINDGGNLWKGDHENGTEESRGGEQKRNCWTQVLTASEQYYHDYDDAGDDHCDGENILLGTEDNLCNAKCPVRPSKKYRGGMLLNRHYSHGGCAEGGSRQVRFMFNRQQ